jgi:sulfite exporter TauE/SafE
VIQQIDLLGFFTLGVLGGFGHCIGMCSVFVLFVSRQYAPPAGTHAPLAAQLWYASGRIAMYAVLGALAGVLGGVVQLAGRLVGVQRAASIVAGVVLVVWALVALTNAASSSSGGSWFARVAGSLKGRVPGHPLVVGLFLGLLPCGLLYSALIAAVARGGAIEGALALAVFGIGTAPALLGVSLADELLARHRALVNRASQLFILAMGAWFLWQGLA